MVTHIMSFTYEPKIDRVWKGEITQTIREIRPGSRPKKIGDFILFHTWEGRPYRSKWGRRLLVKITDLHPIRVYQWGIINEHGFGCTWGAPGMKELAMKDGIDPPTGQELGRLLMEINKSKEGAEYQIITWRVLEGQEEICHTCKGERYINSDDFEKIGPCPDCNNDRLHGEKEVNR